MSELSNASPKMAAKIEATRQFQQGVEMSAAIYAWKRAQQVLATDADMSARELVAVLRNEATDAKKWWDAQRLQDE